VPRVAASAIETLVLDSLRAMLPPNGSEPIKAEATDRDLIERSVDRITIGKGDISITFSPGILPADVPNPIIVPWTPPSAIRRREIITVEATDTSAIRPIRAEARTRLLHAIAEARSWLAELMTGSVSTDSLAAREGRSERAIRMTLSLAFLAPDIVRAAVDGTLPRGLGVSRLVDLPVDWVDQRKALGIATGRIG